MKNNRKNRKKEFIYHKNRLRLGITKFYCYEKVSNQIQEDKKYTERLINIAIKSLWSQWKLKLRRCEILFRVQDGNDFIKNIHTNKITLSNK